MAFLTSSSNVLDCSGRLDGHLRAIYLHFSLHFKNDLAKAYHSGVGDCCNFPWCTWQSSGLHLVTVLQEVRHSRIDVVEEAAKYGPDSLISKMLDFEIDN